MEEMNKFCAYYTADGSILYNHNSKALRTKREIANGYFFKYSFKANAEDKKATNPFSVWFESLTRRDINTIGFDPSSLECAPDCYNTWKGYSLNNTGVFDTDNLTAVLHHVKDVLANNVHVVVDGHRDGYACMYVCVGEGVCTLEAFIYIVYRKPISDCTSILSIFWFVAWRHPPTGSKGF